MVIYAKVFLFCLISQMAWYNTSLFSRWAGMWSFRYYSTAGILEGNIEKMMSPYELANLEKNSLFFSASYLGVSPKSRNVIFLGHNNIGFASLFWGLQNNGYSEENPYTSYNIYRYDKDGDGVWDREEVSDYSSTQKVSNFEYDWYLGLSKKFGNISAGLIFIPIKIEVDSTYDEELTFARNNLLFGEGIKDSATVVSTEEEDKRSGFLIGLEGGYKGENYNFAFAFGFAPVEEKNDFNLESSEYIDESPEVEDSNFISNQNTTNSVFDWKGYDMGIGLKGGYKIGDNIDFNSYLHIIFSSRDLEEDAGYYGNSKEYRVNETGTGKEVFSYIEDISSKYTDGKFKVNGLTWFNKVTYKLNDKLILGLGLGLNFEKGKTEYMIDSVVSIVENYDNGNGILDANDYVETKDGEYKFSVLNSFANTDIWVPVGLEAKLYKGIKARFGVIYTMSISKVGSDVNVVEYAALTTIRVNGLGDTVVYEVESPLDLSSYKYDYNTHDRLIGYYYGFEWNIYKNLIFEVGSWSPTLPTVEEFLWTQHWQWGVSFKF